MARGVNKNIIAVILIAMMVLVVYFTMFLNQRNEMLEVEEKQLKLGKDVVIVLSRGRSGSGYLMRLVSNIVDADSDRAISGELWQAWEMENMTNPTAVIQEHLQKRRRVVGPRGFIGTKWKPYADNERFDAAWRWIAAEGWAVLFSHRNALDVIISTAKHRHKEVPHCDAGDAACVERLLSKKVYLDAPQALQNVTLEVNAVSALRSKLQALNVRFIEVTYEELVYGSDSARLESLSRIADFILPAGHRNITMSDFAVDIEMTTTYNQSQFVENYEQLKAAFSGTEHAHLLHG